MPLFKLNGSVFSPLLKKKRERGLQQRSSETKIKSLCRLESSSLPCVSFRTLERLNQCRRQLEAVGDEPQGAKPQSLLWIATEKPVHLLETSVTPDSATMRSILRNDNFLFSLLFAFTLLQQCAMNDLNPLATVSREICLKSVTDAGKQAILLCFYC